MGRFLPHPDDIPAVITFREHPDLPRHTLHSISLGGISCNSDRSWKPGSAVDIAMPTLGQDARYPGYIAWCEKRPSGYRVGIAFTDAQTLFGARMGEQVCQIEHYCKLQQQQNPHLNTIEALALEWINQNAVEFSQAILDRALVQPSLD